MPRKRITQLFPWLIPLRKRQRTFCYYQKMKWDSHQYAQKIESALFPHVLNQSRSLLYNWDTGFDMKYQENKVSNLKLAANCLHKLIIRPGETFSLLKAIQYADKDTPYLEGLTLINGKLTTVKGGGMCQISNLLFWMFLHSPLTILERHGHKIKEFPDPKGDTLIGVDATITEGWLDLKVKNETQEVFQIQLSFTEDAMVGTLCSNLPQTYRYAIQNTNLVYLKEQKRIFQEVEIRKEKKEALSDKVVSSSLLYKNRCQIGYPLSSETLISKKEES